jgi:hypothetical protein
MNTNNTNTMFPHNEGVEPVVNGETIIAVNDAVDPNGVGAIVYWGGLKSVYHDRLRRSWIAAGLDPDLLPRQTIPSKALGVAMKELASTHRLVRPLEGRGAFALVDETVLGKEIDPEYQTLLRAYAERDGRLRVECRSDHAGLADRLREEYDEALNKLPVTDVGLFVTNSVKMLHAVPLRPSGGIYFVPRQYSEILSRIITAMTNACDGMSVFRIPAMQAKDALDAISSALNAETDAELAAMETEIAEFYASDNTSLGKRALRGRLGTLTGLNDKLSTYESLLSTRLDAFRERMTALQANVTRGILALEADEDAQAA